MVYNRLRPPLLQDRRPSLLDRTSCYPLHSWSHPTRPPRHTTGLPPRVSEVPSLYPPTPCREARYQSRHPAAAGSGRAAIELEEAGRIAHETERGCTSIGE